MGQGRDLRPAARAVAAASRGEQDACSLSQRREHVRDFEREQNSKSNNKESAIAKQHADEDGQKKVSPGIDQDALS
eukprot:670896-Rhodomonas_salina.3